MHFSKEIHSKVQDTSVTFPSKPELGTLLGLVQIVEGELVFRVQRTRCVFCKACSAKAPVFTWRQAGVPGTKVPVRESPSGHLQRLVFKFISVCVSHNVGSQNFHARWPSCVGN